MTKNKKSASLLTKINTFISLYKYHLLIFLFLIVLFLSYETYYGRIFEEKVEYTSYAIGKLSSSDKPSFGFDERDYELVVSFESKGAFIVGREIHVSVDLKPIRNIDYFKKSELKVVFPGSIEFPIQIEKKKRSSLTEIALTFYNDSVAHGEKDIVYLMPEFNGESVTFLNSDKPSYNLFIDRYPQTPDKILRFNPFLYLAPMETELELKNNRLTLILTYFIVYLTIVQILLSLPNIKNDEKS